MSGRTKTSLEERMVALLRKAARGRSRPETIRRKAAELLADRALRGGAADYTNRRPGWWPECGFSAQDRTDWN